MEDKTQYYSVNKKRSNICGTYSDASDWWSESAYSSPRIRQSWKPEKKILSTLCRNFIELKLRIAVQFRTLPSFSYIYLSFNTLTILSKVIFRSTYSPKHTVLTLVASVPEDTLPQTICVAQGMYRVQRTHMRWNSLTSALIRS